MIIDAVIYGETPNAKIEKFESAPPLNKLKMLNASEFTML